MKTRAASRYLSCTLVALIALLGTMLPRASITARGTALALSPAAWYARGDWNDWGLADPMVDDGTGGDALADDGIYTAQVTTAAPGRYEFKVASADWSDGCLPACATSPQSGNSWLYTAVPGEVVTLTFDTQAYEDGWLPDTRTIGVTSEPGAWTAVGDWQGWDNASAATAMASLGDGLYTLTIAIDLPGSHEVKAVKSGTWDAIGADGRSVNAQTVRFETRQAGQNATFAVNALSGRIQVAVEAVPARPQLDGDIRWEGLGHDSRSDLYRVPGGAVTTGTPVTLRFRTFHQDVTGVTLRTWSTAAGAQTLYPMQQVATVDDPPYGYDYWQATLPAQAEPTILWYRFIVHDGADEDFYEDDDLLDGGWGTPYAESPDHSFQIDVYRSDFETPGWIQNAVIYQIFPDRFYNGNRRNDPRPADPTVYGSPVVVQPWTGLPEGYCRAYEDVTCDEEPLGRDFFGGDLQGVIARLDYLQRLGVTAIYLNPIFQAPSNHLYDTTDYTRIDPYLGTIDDYERLVQMAWEKGMRVILDGVFNHTSSDSVYFDRYSRYPTLGAYESRSSPFYEWYTFSHWPDEYSAWWGFDSLPVLAEVQEVRDLIYGGPRSVARWWVELGAAGWRLDVAPDKSHEWWQGFRSRVKSVDADAVLLGEIWDDASAWLLGDEFDSTMNYRFRRALIGFVNGSTNDPNQGAIRGLSPDQFDGALRSIQEDYPPPAFAAAMNLVGSHDTQRILWVLTPGDRNRQAKEFDAANLAQGKARLELVALLQMTLPGAPAIYYGDEVGLTGDTDPDDRRPFPWQDQDPDLLAHYRALANLRQAHTFLRTGSFDRLYADNDDGTYAYGRKDTSGAAVVAANRDSTAHDLVIDLRGYIPEGTLLTDALDGGIYPVAGGRVTLTVPCRWGAILVTPPGTDLVPPAAPASLAASDSDALVELAWKAVPGAAGYHVYRSPVSGGGYTRLNKTPLARAAYADDEVTNGRRYYYVVTAVDRAGNESGRSNEAGALPHLVIGWANLQCPPGIEHTVSALHPTADIYGQAWIAGHINTPGPAGGLLAQVGYGPDGSEPDGNPAWSWVDAVFGADVGQNDEFRGQLLPEAAGAYDYAYRYTTTGGREWIYADLDGTDSGYSPARAGELTVVPSSDTTAPAVPDSLWLVEASAESIRLAWNPVADADLYRYEIYRADAAGGSYARIGDVLAPAAAYTDWEVTSGETYSYVVSAVDTSFNRSFCDEGVPGAGYSGELTATARARVVQVILTAALPDTTPGDADVYIGGTFNGWDPAGTRMARTTLSATVTLPFDEGTRIEFKYTLGSWSYVEKGAACVEIPNRSATVVYGAGGTMSLDGIVLNWRGTGPCGD